MPNNRVTIKRLFVLLLLLAWTARAAYAHPMGNFSVNHHTRITLDGNTVEIQYVIDMAEIPAYQEMQESGINVKEGGSRLTAYLTAKGEALKSGLQLTVEGQRLSLHQIARQIIFPPGAGGLPTMKIGFTYRAEIPSELAGLIFRLHYKDANYEGRAGWKEIVVKSPAAALVSSSVSETDRSGQLSNYPTDLLTSPPQDLEASISFRPGALLALRQASPAPKPSLQLAQSRGVEFSRAKSRGKFSNSRTVTANKPFTTGRPSAVPAPAQVAAPAPDSAQPMQLEANKQATPRSAFTELISTKNLSFWFLFVAAAIAAGLGALHALEPGHGKTIVAAYLVGSRGTARHAFLLGIIVTISHTTGVFALGAVTLYASRYIVPEQLYPWLGMMSGLIIAGMGAFMFLRRWTGEDGNHSHASGEPHSDWFFSTGNQAKAAFNQQNVSAEPRDEFQKPGDAQPVSLYQLLMLGITGGMIPCPAALVVLLSAIALHRIGFGLFLIVAFSVGLATVLIGSGMVMVYARRFMARWQSDGPFTTRWLPLISSAFMAILGCVIAVRALTGAGIGTHVFTKGNLAPFLVVTGLGLFLGIRHSTDPDHVVAVSTFVSKQRTIRHAILIGLFWGLGHTLTILLVGSAIIIFGVVIPPRLGLSMEFSVALMLILLGILNLSGMMRLITDRFSKPQESPLPSDDSDLRELAAKEQVHRTKMERLLDSTVGRFGLYQCLRPLIVGIVHGLAGSAAVALLVLSTIRSPLWATAYLLIFGIGTMVGMMLMTAVIALPFAYTGHRFTLVNKYLGVTSGVVSLAFGTFLVYQIGFVAGLFSSNPQWTPH